MIKITNSPPACLYAPDFFRTNRTFTDRDQKLIRQHLDHAEATLLDIVDRGIQGLSRQERELADCIERCRVALAPIKNLPDDVLQYMFIICCESPTEFLSRDPKPLVSTLCQVCSAWRSLALETPVLWSQISLQYDISFSHAHIPSYVEGAVKLWLTRARTCPISLEAGVKSYGWMEGLSNLVGRIFALRSRYRKIVLNFYSTEIDILLERLSPYQLWNLEELETVNVDELVGDEILNLPFSPITPFASLKKLIDTGYWNSNNLTNLLPFPRLQTLNIRKRTTMRLVLEIFKQCPLLETCEVVMGHFDSTIHSWVVNRTSYITLPQLRSLWMRFDSIEDCCYFIDQLVLSNLRSLMIFASNETMFHHSAMSNHSAMVEHVVALSQRSSTPTLREIYFNRTLVPILNPGILLRSLPHLEKLVTYGCVALDDGTLDGLTMGTIGRCLTNLHADDIEADLGAITRMAKQRAQNVGLNMLYVTTSKSALGESGWNDWSSLNHDGS